MRSNTRLITKHTSRQSTPTKEKQGANKHYKEHHFNGLYHEGQEVPEPWKVRPPPVQLRDLECIRKLGTGAYASVLLVRMRPREQGHRLDRSGSLFALKVLPKVEMRNFDKKRPDDVDAERETLCRLQWSPWIGGVVDAFHDSLNVYLMLECIPAGVLHDIIHRRGPLDANTARFYYANIVCALEFLHSNKIVHRDLKPANILVKSDGYIALVDFGLAKPEAKCHTWVMVGTPFYMAPELGVSEGGIGYGVDWWSSGVILYEMVTQRVPFYGKDEAEIYRRMTRYEWPRGVDIGESLKSMVAGLLTRDPTSRLGVAKRVSQDPWLSGINWKRMDGHSYIAPWVPGEVHLCEKWQDQSLQESVPGVRVVVPPARLRHDDRLPRGIRHTSGSKPSIEY